jgi:hypothetical protein
MRQSQEYSPSPFPRPLTLREGSPVTTSRKLEDIASDLGDLSVTLEEIKDNSKCSDASKKKLDKVQADMDRAADSIEETLDPELPS